MSEISQISLTDIQPLLDAATVLVTPLKGMFHSGIQMHDCENALVAGVNVMLSPKTPVRICNLQVNFL